MKQQHRDILIIKVWGGENHTVKDGIKEVINIIQGLQDSLLEIMSTYGMELMDPLPKRESMQPRIQEVIKYRVSTLEMIERIEEVKREGIKCFLSNQIRSSTHMESYVRNLGRESIELTHKLFNIEHQLARMKIPYVSELLEMHAQWRSFVKQQSSGTQEKSKIQQQQEILSSFEVLPAVIQ